MNTYRFDIATMKQSDIFIMRTEKGSDTLVTLNFTTDYVLEINNQTGQTICLDLVSNLRNN